jgi:hypothetical protein
MTNRFKALDEKVLGIRFWLEWKWSYPLSSPLNVWFALNDTRGGGEWQWETPLPMEA